MVCKIDASKYNQPHHLSPAKLLCIFVHPQTLDMCILVHPFHNHGEEDTVLTTCWRYKYIQDENGNEWSETPYLKGEFNIDLDPVIMVINIDEIDKHCLMIPYHSTSKFMFEVVDIKLWAKKFY